ncbi:unnamed protein product [Mesocestoides corti]|uniref:FLZ-type domain-containing protein n=1 Tax=Mesocestoides corti TaxID=53468 RepID=A0A0R3U6S9_MESCO|nr:unnamed protein product [Mesocestoides corti]
MDEQPNLHPTRQLSSRKSKPSIEDLIDHHRPVYWISSSGSSHDGHINGDTITDPMRIRIRVSRLDAAAVSQVGGSTSAANRQSAAPALNSSASARSSPPPPFVRDSDPLRPPVQNGGLDAWMHLGSESESSSDSDEEEDNLPLSDLCKRVSTTTEQPSPPPKSRCTASMCERPALTSDNRWDGQFCSSDCLVKACREAFDAMFQNHHHYLTPAFENPASIVS